MMPLHPPTRTLGAYLKETTEKSLLAEQLGFDELWVGEHFSATSEPITLTAAGRYNANPLQLAGTLQSFDVLHDAAIPLRQLQPQRHPARESKSAAGEANVALRLCSRDVLLQDRRVADGFVEDDIVLQQLCA
jgi:hypothetical protein